MMTPAQLFGVAMRTIGLLTTIAGTWSVCVGMVVLAFGSGAGIVSLVGGIPAMLVGLWLLRGPESLIAFAYPDEPAGAV